MFQKIEKEFYKQSEKNLIERVQQMKETKKNHKINFDSMREHEQRMREISEQRRRDEQARMREEAKVNLKITGILESFKEKFQPTNYDAIRKSLKIEMIHRQHNFAEQVV